jgi:hypothetical protein
MSFWKGFEKEAAIPAGLHFSGAMSKLPVEEAARRIAARTQVVQPSTLGKLFAKYWKK